MKKIRIILLSFLVVFTSMVSCDDRLDINTDPLAATSANPNAVLPFAFVAYSARKSSDLGTRMADVAQYMSANFFSPANGTSGGTITGNTWDTYFTDALGNLALVRQDAAAAGPTSNNVAAVATILSMQIFLELTSIWEDIPFSEALDGQQFPQPQFDAQQDVLNGIVASLNEAINLIDTRQTEGEFVISPSSDQYFRGDLNQWRIYANSLKLRALMMLRNGGANVDAEITQTLGQPLMENNSDAAVLRYSGESGARNAVFQIIPQFFGPDNESQDVWGPGIPIDNLLRGSGDPRYDLWIARNDLPAPPFAQFPDQTTSVLSNNIIRGDLPDIAMLPDEIWLYRAELAFEGFPGAGDAESHYRTGVTRALEWWGRDVPGIITVLDPADITAYVNSLPAPTINDIYNQQYLAAFLMPVLSWNHVRRNKVPVLDPPPGSTIGTILRRFTYPPDESDANVNTPANQLTSVPQWFENE